jgi:hypothetical protein
MGKKIHCKYCNKVLYFDKHPEFDVCTRCGVHICIDCGCPDIINGDSMCKKHRDKMTNVLTCKHCGYKEDNYAIHTCDNDSVNEHCGACCNMLEKEKNK